MINMLGSEKAASLGAVGGHMTSSQIYPFKMIIVEKLSTELTLSFWKDRYMYMQTLQTKISLFI